jgi:hypothetical protein
MPKKKLTDFSDLTIGSKQEAEAYTGVSTVSDAKEGGPYEENRKGLQKPWTLPIYRPPDIRPIG